MTVPLVGGESFQKDGSLELWFKGSVMASWKPNTKFLNKPLDVKN